MTTTQCRLMVLSFIAAFSLVLAFLLAPLMGHAQSATPAASPASGQSLLAEGEKTYNNLCIACHRAGGMGVKGIYPTLAGDPLVTLADPKPMIATVLNGRGGMPRFGGSFNDEQIAAIVSYVRSAWGNNASAVTPDEVAQVRASFVVTPVSGTPITSTEQSPHGGIENSAGATPTP